MVTKKIFAIIIAAMIIVSMTPVVLARDVASVSITPSGDVDMIIDQTRKLNAKVSPSSADDTSIYWESSDYSVVEVDDDGRITAVGEGSARITAVSHNNRKATVYVSVFENQRALQDFKNRLNRENGTTTSSTTTSTPRSVNFFTGAQSSASTQSSASNNNNTGGTNFITAAYNAAKGQSQSSTTNNSATSGGTNVIANNFNSTAYAATAQEISIAVNNALKSAAPGTTAAATISGGRTSVEGEALRSAYASAANAGKQLTIRFTTPDSSNAVQGQLNVSAANAANAVNINPAVYTTDEHVSVVRTAFQPVFSGKPVAVIKCGQTGSYGMNVDVIGKVNLSNFNQSNLVIYTYDIDTNHATKLENPSYKILDGGYLCLTTNVGGYIIITN